MPNRTTAALIIGLAGAFAMSAATGAMAASKKKPHPAVLQANASTTDSVANARIPVLAHQMAGYRPGLCHIITDRNRELGYWDKCPAGRTNPGP